MATLEEYEARLGLTAGGAPKKDRLEEFEERLGIGKPPPLGEGWTKDPRGTGYVKGYKTPIDEPAPKPSLAAEAWGRTKEIGRGFGALGTAIANPIDTATSGPKRRQLLRGIDDVATLGYGQKLAGAIEEALPEALQTGGESLRDTEASDQEEAPDERTGGNILGIGVPSPGRGLATAGYKTAGKAIKGDGLVKNVARGVVGYEAAAVPSAALHASSEGDRAGAALRAATDPIGLATAVAGGVVAHKASGAVARVEEAEIGALKKGAQGSTRTKVFGKNGKNEPGIREAMQSAPEVRRAVVKDDIPAAQAATQKRLDPIVARLDEVYEKAQSATPGARMEAMDRALRDVAATYSRTSAERPLVAALKEIRDGIREQYKGQTHIPLQGLREEYRAWQNIGYQGAKQFTVPAQAQLKMDVANALREVLHEEVERVAKRNPKLEISVDELKALNKQASSWIGIKTLLDEKGTRKPAGAGTFGQIISSNSVRAKVRELAEATGEAADRFYARLVTAAQNGDAGAAAKLRYVHGAGAAAPVSVGVGGSR